MPSNYFKVRSVSDPPYMRVTGLTSGPTMYLQVIDVGSLYISGTLIIDGVDKTQTAVSEYKSIQLLNSVFIPGTPTGNGVFYYYGNKLYFRRLNFDWSRVTVGMKLPIENVVPVPQDVYAINITRKLSSVVSFTMYKNDEPLNYQDILDNILSFDVTVNDTVYHVVKGYNSNYHYFQKASTATCEIRGPGGQRLAPFVLNETYTLSNVATVAPAAMLLMYDEEIPQED